MSSATLATPVATQLTFPWAAPETGDGVRHRVSPTAPAPKVDTQHIAIPRSEVLRAEKKQAARMAPLSHTTVEEGGVRVLALRVAVQPEIREPEVATCVADSLVGERLGKPMRIGSVMFRLLKSYGITDEEIAEGIAAYGKSNA